MQNVYWKTAKFNVLFKHFFNNAAVGLSTEPQMSPNLKPNFLFYRRFLSVTNDRIFHNSLVVRKCRSLKIPFDHVQNVRLSDERVLIQIKIIAYKKLFTNVFRNLERRIFCSNKLNIKRIFLDYYFPRIQLKHSQTITYVYVL